MIFGVDGTQDAIFGKIVHIYIQPFEKDEFIKSNFGILMAMNMSRDETKSRMRPPANYRFNKVKLFVRKQLN